MSTSLSKQEAIHFYADGLKIAGHFTPAVGAKSGSRSPTIVCIHGYTGRKEIYMPGYIRELTAAGFNALSFTTVDTGTVKVSNCVASRGIKSQTFTAL